jgi:O-antigen/teichoic acid export membrane protein
LPPSSPPELDHDLTSQAPNILTGSDHGKRALAALAVFANFAFAKVIILAAPIGIAAITIPGIYGRIEVAYAFALIIAGLPLSGPLHGISHRYLMGEQPIVADQTYALIVTMCGLSLLGVVCGYLLGALGLVLMAIAMVGVTAFQVCAAFLLRMRGKLYLMAWSEGVTLLFVGLLACVGLFIPTGRPLAIFIGGLAGLSLVGFLAAAGGLARTLQPELRSRIVASTRLGLPMCAFGLFNSWAGVSGRVLVGLLSLEDAAAYGVAFRFSAAAVGIYTLATTVLWSRIYTASTQAADRMLAGFLAVVAVLVFLVSLVGPWLIASLDLLALDRRSLAVAPAILPVVALQMFFWAGQSLLQPRINRTGSAGKSLVPMIVIAVAGVALILAAHLLGVGFVFICWLLALYSAAFFFGTLMVLAWNDKPHRYMAWTGAVGGALLALEAIL